MTDLTPASSRVFSIIIPARNEERMIAGAIESSLQAMESWRGKGDAPGWGRPDGAEVIVVDNSSVDGTGRIVASLAKEKGIRHVVCSQLGAARARNCGAAASSGRILVFMDADTRMPPESLTRIQRLCDTNGYGAGITRLASLEGGLRAWCWWTFWCQVRRLPLAKAKAMPAFMFCTREVFSRFGPFDEEVSIAEEWPILAGLYSHDRRRLIYDRSITARSSNRRMELQSCGYLRNMAK